MSDKLKDQLNKILKNAPPNRHSYFQLQYFIIGKEPTVQGKIWQCLRELDGRNESLQNIDLEIEETTDNIELIDIETERYNHTYLPSRLGIDTGEADLDIKERAINKKKAQRRKHKLVQTLESLHLKKKNTLEEVEFFIKSYNCLTEKENVKSFDNLEAQTQYWNAKLTEKIHLGQISNTPVSADVISTILALPHDAPIKKETIYTIEKIQEKMLEAKSQQGV